MNAGDACFQPGSDGNSRTSEFDSQIRDPVLCTCEVHSSEEAEALYKGCADSVCQKGDEKEATAQWIRRMLEIRGDCMKVKEMDDEDNNSVTAMEEEEF